MQKRFLARPCLWQREGTWLCSAPAPAGLAWQKGEGRKPGFIKTCLKGGPALWGYPFPAPKNSPGGADLNWVVLQCLALPGHVFNGWFPALVCTGNSACAPGMDSSCFSHSHAGREMSQESSLCSFIYWKRWERPEWEWKFRKLGEIPGTKTVSRKTALIFFPFGNPGVCCESWQPCSPRSHSVSYRQLWHAPSALIWVFCLPFPRAGRCKPSLSGAAAGTACLMEVSLCSFLISKVFHHLIKPTPKCR